MDPGLKGFELLGPIEDEPSVLLIKKGDRFFRVSAASWEIVSGLSSGRSDDAIARDVEKHLPGMIVSAHQLAKIKTHVLSQLAADTTPRKSLQLWATVDLIGQDKLVRLVRALPIIPREGRWFYALLAAAIALNLMHLAVDPNLIWHVLSTPVSNESIAQSAIVIMSMIVIMVLHELGHAAAVQRFGLRPARIGAGFFLIFPALFADVSEIWRLRREKRIIVNLSGTFVQLWIGALLSTLLLFAPKDLYSVISAVYVVNLVAVAVNLIPFAKLDGYWVFADALDCPDLHARAFRALARIFGFHQNRDQGVHRNEQILVLFGIGNLAFYGCVAIYALSVIFRFLVDTASSPAPLGFVTYTFLERPIPFLMSALLLYRMSGMLARLVNLRTVKA